MRVREGHVVCFGEVMLRLATPAGRVIAAAQSLDLTIGGAEANVAVALTSLGHEAWFVGRVPDNQLGAKARAAIAATGVDIRHFGFGPGRMGLYFFEIGASLRPSAITYDRGGSAFATAAPEDFDFHTPLQGASLFHISGITAALNAGGARLLQAGISAAIELGVPISFDCNFRETLWGAWDSNPRLILNDLIAQVNVLFGNHRDMTLLLGKPFSGDGPERRREAVDAAFAAFPKLEVMASTARQALTQSHHRLSARVDTRADLYQTQEVEITDIVDRLGTGDAFTAGVLTGWLEGGDARRMAQLGLASNALKHSLQGDFFRLPRAEVEAFTGIGGDVRR
jgi:2-dehydro-3-deoxygluconokinase